METFKSHKHILVAEDEKHARLSLSLILRQGGYEVTVVEDGREALEIITTNSNAGQEFDLILTDIQMPHLNGIELIDRLKETGINTPVISITGFGDKNMVIELLRRGCAEYLDKPFSAEEVLKRVKDVLANEEKKQQSKQDQQTVRDLEKHQQEREITSYKARFLELKSQVDSAVDSYQQLLTTEQLEGGLPLAVRVRQLAGLGGDFFDIRSTPTGYDMLIADVAGHDMGASYHAVLLKAFFDENCRIGNDGPTFFKLLNKQLLDHGRNERMVTAIFLRVDLQLMQAEIISAGHPPLIITSPSFNNPQLLSPAGPVLGLFDEVEYTQQTIDIQKRNRFFLFTDGLYGVTRLNRETLTWQKLGVPGLATLINQCSAVSINEAVDCIWSDILDYCSNKPEDDMLLVGMEIPESFT